MSDPEPDSRADSQCATKERIVALKLLPQAISWTVGIGTQWPQLVEAPPRRSVQGDVRQHA
jgi:hypothetical protein